MLKLSEEASTFTTSLWDAEFNLEQYKPAAAAAMKVETCRAVAHLGNVLHPSGDMCMDICIHTCGDMCMDMCMDMFADVCMDMCMDWCMDM